MDCKESKTISDYGHHSLMNKSDNDEAQSGNGIGEHGKLEEGAIEGNCDKAELKGKLINKELLDKKKLLIT